MEKSFFERAGLVEEVEETEEVDDIGEAEEIEEVEDRDMRGMFGFPLAEGLVFIRHSVSIH